MDTEYIIEEVLKVATIDIEDLIEKIKNQRLKLEYLQNKYNSVILNIGNQVDSLFDRKFGISMSLDNAFSTELYFPDLCKERYEIELEIKEIEKSIFINELTLKLRFKNI